MRGAFISISHQQTIWTASSIYVGQFTFISCEREGMSLENCVNNIVYHLSVDIHKKVQLPHMAMASKSLCASYSLVTPRRFGVKAQ